MDSPDAKSNDHSSTKKIFNPWSRSDVNRHSDLGAFIKKHGPPQERFDNTPAPLPKKQQVLAKYHMPALETSRIRQKLRQSTPNRSFKRPCLVTYVASEFRSSQTSTCHHCCVKSVKRQGQKQRATVLQCLGCATLHSRDFNAAHVIADVFLAMQATHSSGLPDWITVDAIRQSNLLIPLAVMRMQSQISRHGYLLILRAHEKILEHIV
jgi:hypothetical protein